MKKVFKIEVDCAVCAGKVETAIGKMDGVNSASINFMTQKLLLDVEDEKAMEVINSIEKVAKKIEPDFVLYK